MARTDTNSLIILTTELVFYARVLPRSRVDVVKKTNVSAEFSTEISRGVVRGIAGASSLMP